MSITSVDDLSLLPPDPYSNDPWSWTRVIFRPIEGSFGYGVDTEGDVWSCINSHSRPVKEWRRLKARPDKDGYLSVTIRRGEKRQTVKVAHLVLSAFIGPRRPGWESCHYPDSSPRNNRLNNLRWGTHKENIRHKVELGTVARGERHGMAQLTRRDVGAMRLLRFIGMKYSRIGDGFGVSASHACSIVHGKYRVHG